VARWIAKAAVQKGITILPTRLHHSVNGLFQRYVTRGTVLTDRVLRERLRSAAHHVERIQGGETAREDTILELGTGWHPIVPIALHLCGYQQIASVDLVRHCTRASVYATAERLTELHQRGTLRDLLPEYDGVTAEKLAEKLATIGAKELDPAELGITFLLRDARQLPFQTGSIGSVVSNNVLEHIYPQVLLPTLQELRRTLSTVGVMSHIVDLSDHFAHLDPSITPYNFLRFSDAAWRWIDNSIQPQSRLRVDDYLDLLQSARLELTWSETEADRADELDEVPLAPRFRSKPAAVNAVTTLAFTARA
jgi:SAM-dependent methyltransferase